MKFVNMTTLDCELSGHIKGTMGKCLICGNPTEFIEIASGKRFCSTECEDAFYAMMEMCDIHGLDIKFDFEEER